MNNNERIVMLKDKNDLIKQTAEAMGVEPTTVMKHVTYLWEISHQAPYEYTDCLLTKVDEMVGHNFSKLRLESIRILNKAVRHFTPQLDRHLLDWMEKNRAVVEESRAANGLLILQQIANRVHQADDTPCHISQMNKRFAEELLNDDSEVVNVKDNRSSAKLKAVVEDSVLLANTDEKVKKPDDGKKYYLKSIKG